MIAEPRTTAEQYASAATTSDMTLRSHAQGAADVIIAAGFAQRTFGHALARLRSERDSSGADPARCPSWGLVVKVITARIRQRQAVDLEAGPLIRWWLNPTCKACGGGGYELVPGSNRQSARKCKACGGRGKTEPTDADGREFATFLDSCTAAYAAAIGRSAQAKRSQLATKALRTPPIV